jgi:hypothetical protein
MDFAINDRQPTITLIKSRLADLQKKITAYKTAVNKRYNLDYNIAQFANDASNNKWVRGNNGSVTCNKYCHGKNGASWNNELPSNWKGAQCLSAGANYQFGCDDINVYDIKPSNYVERPVLPSIFSGMLSGTRLETFGTIREGITSVAEGVAVPPAGTDDTPAAAAATGLPGAPVMPGGTAATAGQLTCLCQRNDTFPFSSAASGDDQVPPNLYNFNTGGNTVHQMTCGDDQTVKKVNKQCLKDLWANTGCTLPLDISNNGLYTLPGTSYVFDVSNDMVDMTKADINLGNLTTIISEATEASPSHCGQVPYLSEMRDDIIAELDEINSLIISTNSTMADNIIYKDRNSPVLLAQIMELKSTFDELKEDLQAPVLLDGNYEMTTIRVASKYGNYVLYLLLTLFMVGSLLYIFKNPEVGNLDMFILVLAVIIFVYYIYEYIQNRKRK